MNLLVEAAVPKVLYHATYAPYLPSIQDHGLDADRGCRNYDASEKGVIYLATSPEVAISYAEVSEEVPEAFLDQIVVLAIPTASLDKSLIRLDRNVLTDEPEHGQTFEYHCIIDDFSVI